MNSRQNSVKCILQHVEANKECHTSMEATVKWFLEKCNSERKSKKKILNRGITQKNCKTAT